MPKEKKLTVHLTSFYNVDFALCNSGRYNTILALCDNENDVTCKKCLKILKLGKVTDMKVECKYCGDATIFITSQIEGQSKKEILKETDFYACKSCGRVTAKEII